MGITKTCNTCKENKSIRYFYIQKKGLHGRTGSCKECRGEYQKNYHRKNIEKRREWGRKQRKCTPNENAEKYLIFKKKNPNYWKDYYKQNSEKRLASNRRFFERHPERVEFYKKYYTAIRKGILVRPNECSICGEKVKTVGHHFNYEDPLKVTWMCAPCHHAVHSRQRSKNRKSVTESISSDNTKTIDV